MKSRLPHGAQDGGNALADNLIFAAWRRFLAQPVDSRGKTLLMAFLVSAVCAAMVTGATVLLRPVQQANRAAEQQARLEALVAAIPGMEKMLAQADGAALSVVVVDLTKAAAARDVTPATLEAALQLPENWTALPPEADMAGIGHRPDLAQIYLLRDADAVSLVILPVFGAGYNGMIEGMLALHADMETIAGFTVTRHSETPGLGARIEEPAWQASFAGKRFADDAGNMRFSVARGPSASAFEVDGITGATRTSNGVSRIVRFWLGPDGYGPLLAAIRRGAF
jgi:Na+-transporting NADH:ubiquinone oxidoreductase subunit C